MASGNKVLILTEAGTDIGYGHYTRCYAIKQYFESKDVFVDIYLNVKGLQSGRFEDVTVVDWVNLNELNGDGKYAYALIDSYLAPKLFFDKLKSEFNNVIAIDDYGRIDGGVDLIINPNIFGDRIKYSGVSVGGSRYVILRKAFRSERRKNEIRKNVEHVLITLGGNDIHKLIPVIVRQLLELNRKANLHIVAGTEEYCEKLRNKFEKNLVVKVYGFASEELMRDLMLKADLVVSACGQTLHELAWLAVPTIGICVGDDQILNMKEYVTNGFLDGEIYWNEVEFQEKLLQRARNLLAYDERKERSNRAKGLASSNGLENIYEEIIR